jgi:hypothetical protein
MFYLKSNCPYKQNIQELVKTSVHYFTNRSGKKRKVRKSCTGKWFSQSFITSDSLGLIFPPFLPPFLPSCLPFFVVLGFGFRASCLLAQVGLGPWSSYLFLLCSWDDSCAPSHPTCLSTWDLTFFCLNYPWTTIFPVSGFWVDRITGIQSLCLASFSSFSIVVETLIFWLVYDHQE